MISFQFFATKSLRILVIHFQAVQQLFFLWAYVLQFSFLITFDNVFNWTHKENSDSIMILWQFSRRNLSGKRTHVEVQAGNIWEKFIINYTGSPAAIEATPVRCPVNCNTTGTLTQYKSTVNGWSQVSFSEFWDEILNAKDQTVYQIVAIKKLHLI